MKSKTLKVAGSLIAGVFAVGIGLGYGIVVAPAGPAETESLAQADGGESELEQFFPDAEFEEIEEDVHRATEGGETVGLIGQGTGSGYEDGIVALVAVDMEGEIVGVDILEQNETEDLGDVIAEDDFLDQFEGLTADSVALSDDGGEIDGISGATQSSEGVVNIVTDVIDELSEHM
ncbi:MAG: FMN-binding protein [Spirochaetales bacterium]